MFRTGILFLAAAALAAEAQQFTISTYAGGPPASTPVRALVAAIGTPQGIAADAAGNVYFTSLIRDYPAYDHGRHGVFKLDRAGVLTRIAGNTGEGYSGDGGPAVDARLRLSNLTGDSTVPGIAVDRAGNIYIADTGNNRIRKVSPSGTITTVAGDGTPGLAGDGGPAIRAQLNNPSHLAVDLDGTLYISGGDRIRKVSSDGNITTVSMHGGAIAVDTAKDLYIAEGGSVHKVSPNGTDTMVAGEDASSIAVDSGNNVYLGEGARIRRVTPGGIITTLAGHDTCGYSGDGELATSAQVCVQGLAVDRHGNLLFTDATFNRVREISSYGGISTVAGTGDCCYSGDGGAVDTAQFNFAPWGGGLAIDGAGNVYIADAANQRVRKLSREGIITTVAGTSSANGFSGDGGPAKGARLSYPAGVAIDSRGNLYIADVGNQRVRKVSPDGMISTELGASGRALAVDQADSLYFADESGVHKVARTGTITTLTAVALNEPFAATVDSAGNYYAAEIGGGQYRVRKVTPDGVITTVAGTGVAGYSGDGGPAINAQLNGPVALAIDRNGNLYIADSFNNRIRVVSASGTITTVAGNGGTEYSGDGGPAIDAQLGSLSGLAIDRDGNLFAADQYFNVVRLLQPGGSRVTLAAAVNAASNALGPIAPGELVVFYGSGLGPARLVSGTAGGNGLYPEQLAGTVVRIGGIPARLVYTSAKQVAAVIPDSVSLGSAQVTIGYQGQTSPAVAVPVVAAAPGLFTVDASGQGHAATINQDGSFNSPVVWGEIITLFVTGAGHATSGMVTFSLGGTPYRWFVPISAGDMHEGANGVTSITLAMPTSGMNCDASTVVQLGDATTQDGVTISMLVCI